MHAVDVTVSRVLERPSSRKKGRICRYVCG
ncbi:hypothetical protein ISN45_At02g040470, partial [Arabidopsis thaliana x Arabidopsis arenosa]